MRLTHATKVRRRSLAAKERRRRAALGLETLEQRIVLSVELPFSAWVEPEYALAPLHYFTVYFNERIDRSTVGLEDLTSFTDPHGHNLLDEVYDFYVGDWSVDFYFYDKRDTGAYQLTFGPDVNDIYGNPMPEPLSAEIWVDDPWVDLQPTLISAPVEAAVGEDFWIDYEVLNLGDDLKSEYWYYWRDVIYISPTEDFDHGNAEWVGEFYADAGETGLGSGESYEGGAWINIPHHLGAGDYYLFVVADEYEYLNDLDRSNNALGTPIRITPSDVDLVVTEASTPSVAVVGERIEVSYTVTNLGSTSAPGHYNEIHLSLDDVFDSSDIYLGYDWIDRLEPGASREVTRTITPPNRWAGETVYLLFVADAYGYVSETDETNNTWAAPITLRGPDLVVTEASAPSEAAVGERIEVSHTVTNQGSAAAKWSYYDLVYLSLDDALDNSDALLASQWRSASPGLEVGASYESTLSVTLPSSWGSRSGYLLFVADGYDYLSETDETNNVRAVPITLRGPDLVMIEASATPLELTPGDRFSYSYTVQNQGDREVEFLYYDAIYVSDDEVLGGDQLVGEVYVGNRGVLAPGATYQVSGEATLPATAAGGERYLLFAANTYGSFTPYHYVGEAGDPRNNVRAIAVTITPPNLTPTSLTMPDEGIVNGTIAATWSVENNGPTVAKGRWADYFYLSTDDVYDSNDIYIGSVSAGSYSPLASGASYSRTSNLTIPSTVKPGTYRLIVRVDGGEAQSESDETDNIFVSAETITIHAPDLAVTSASAPSASVVRGNIKVEYRVENLSEHNAPGNWYDYVYLSTSPTQYASYYTRWSFYRSGGLAAGAGYDASRSVTLPNIAPGTYYLFVRTNDQSSQGETDFSNNVLLVGSIQIDAPDLKITAATGPEFAVVNSIQQLTYTVENDSETTAMGPWYDAVYLSTDAVWDSRDTRILINWTSSQTPLEGRGSYTATVDARIPNVAPGEYYLIFRANYAPASYQRETNEGNNTFAAPISIGSPDLTLVSATGPSRAIVGGKVDVTYKVENIGQSHAPGPWYDRVYLSANETMTSSLWSMEPLYRTGGLEAGATYEVSESLTAPNVAPGTYYLFVKTNADSGQGETNFSNNALLIGSIQIDAPDLKITAATGPEFAAVNSIQQLTYTVENDSETAAMRGWYDAVYLSTDAVWDSRDTLILFNWTDSRAPLEGRGSYTASVDARIPNVAPGNYYLIFKANYAPASYQRETNEENNTFALPIEIGSPDLIVASATAPERATVGGKVDVTYEVKNIGQSRAPGPWYDYVYLSHDAYLSSDDVLLDSRWSSADVPLEAGASYELTRTITLPANSSVGDRYLIFVTDARGHQGETNENNNALAVAITLVAPDLTVESVTAPAEVALGGVATAGYRVTNIGDAATTRSWRDRIYYSLDATLGPGDVLLDEIASKPLAPGEHYDVSRTVTIPELAPLGPGYLIVVTDYYNEQGESDESNNTRVAPITIVESRRPNLTVGEVVGPARAASGETIEVSYTVANQGVADASGPWVERIYVSDDAVIGGDRLLASFVTNAGLIAGASAARSRTVTLPEFGAGSAGMVRFVVVVDANNAVIESNEEDNAAISANPTEIPSVLTLALSRSQIPEDASGAPLRATVTRNGDLSKSLTVALASSDSSQLEVPATLTIPAGRTSASVLLSPVMDGVVDGDYLATVTASSPGFSSGTARVWIQDVDRASLTLDLGGDSIIEGPSSRLTGSITAAAASRVDLVIQLSVSPSGQIRLPSTVILPAGELSVNFDITAIDDYLPERTTTVVVQATGERIQPVSKSLEVIDDDLPTLTATVSPSTVVEGSSGVVLTIQRDRAVPAPLTVRLSSGPAGVVGLPTQVVIPAGALSVDAPVTVFDDNLVNGTRVVSLDAHGVYPSCGCVITSSLGRATLTVLDDDGANLTLSLRDQTVREGLSPATIATLTRNTPTDEPLSVVIVSSDPGEATAPALVVIPAGEASVNFAINSHDDNVPDGTKTVTFTASAAGHDSAIATLRVTDVDIPDLYAFGASAPARIHAEERIELTYTLQNIGKREARGPWTRRIFLAHNDAPSADDLLIFQATIDGTVAAGETVAVKHELRLPSVVGEYRLIVVEDVFNNIDELSESNNVAVSNPIRIESPYQVTIHPAPTQAISGTPITLSGRATRIDGGAPAANVPVSVRVIHSNGFRRVLSTATDASGNYSVVFTPLAKEGGLYSVAAGHPGDPVDVVQGQFRLIGFEAVPEARTISLTEEQSVTRTITARSLTDVPLTGLSVEALDVPKNLVVEFREPIPAELPAGGRLELSYTVRALDASIRSADFRIRITTAEGPVVLSPIHVEVTPKRARIDATSRLVSGMPLGRLTTVNLEISNRGGAATGPITIDLPRASWMSAAGGTTVDSLAPGESTIVAILLNPGADLPLGPYSGSIAIRGENASPTTVRFEFRAVSQQRGDLKFSVADESTYYDPFSPMVAGALVRVTDAFDHSLVAEGVTGADGSLILTDLPEGPYDVEVSAEGHLTTRGGVIVRAGEVVEQGIFLRIATVSYTWTVEPVEYEDRYRVVIQSEFATNVPAPVITIDPGAIDLLDVVAAGGVKQVDLTITNHGLIQTEEGRLILPTHPLWEFTALVTDIGVLPARSSITVPVLIRRKDVASGFDVQSAGVGLSALDDPGPCSLTIQWYSTYVCGPLKLPIPVSLPVLNVTGDCGNVWTPPPPSPRPSGGGGGGGWIGGSLSGPSYTYVPFEDCGCDPDTDRDKSIKFSASYFAAVPIAAANAGLKAASAAAKAASGGRFDLEVRLKAEGSVEAGICCAPDGQRRIFANASVEAGVEAKATVYLVPPIGLKDFKYGDLDGTLSLIVGPSISAEVFGGGSIVIDKPCDGELTVCLEASLRASIATKVEITGEASLKYGETEVAGYSVSLFAKIETGLTFAYSYCLVGSNGDGGGLEFRIDPLIVSGGFTAKFKGNARPTWAPEEFELTYNEKWFDGWSYSGADDQEMLAALGFDLGDFSDDDLARMFGYDSLDAMSDALQAQYGVEEGSPVAPEAEPPADPGAPTKPAPAPQPNPPVAPPIDVSTQADDGVCATVTVQIDQQMVMTRTAFAATLGLTNHDNAKLDDLQVIITIYDAATGEVANDRFAISPAELRRIILDPDHDPEMSSIPYWELAPGAEGSARWTLLPTDLAAPTGATQYEVGGVVTYTVNGLQQTIVMQPAVITVYPDAALTLDYFHQRDVYGDDPFTEEIEPSIPFDLAVMVRNTGAGAARNLTITSSQPKIVENEKGLLVDFRIIDSRLDENPVSKSLEINFGDIAPGQTRIGTWRLESSLQGQFTDYSATFTHETGFGDARTSLIKEVRIHELIHTVYDTRPGADGLRDFLVNDIPDDDHAPDTLYTSEGEVLPVGLGQFEGIEQIDQLGLRYHVNLSMPEGFGYVKFASPLSGSMFRLARVLRADGSELPLNFNAWTTDRAFYEAGERPRLEDMVHIFDVGGNQTYVLEFRSIDETGPEVESIEAVSPDPIERAVSSLLVSFTEAIDPASFTTDDLSLCRDGGPNLINPDVTIVRLSPTTYRIDGLGALTGIDGRHVLTIDAAGITDVWGNPGLFSAQRSWMMAASSTAVSSIEGLPEGPTRSVVDAATITFSRPVREDGFGLESLELTLDGGPNLLNSSVASLVRIDATTYRLEGLAGLANVDGLYSFQIDATGVVDANGRAGVGVVSTSWTLDRVAPTIEPLAPLASNPRNIVVPTYLVQFDEAYDPSSFTRDSLALTLDGGPNLIQADDSRIKIVRVDATTARVEGLNWLQGRQGLYQFTILAAGVTDLAGNPARGDQSTSWLLDLEAPDAPTDLAISPDTGVSATDGLTRSRTITLTGRLSEPGLSVRVRDPALGADLGFANVDGLTFSLTVTLEPGSRVLEVRAIDAAGNPSEESATISFVIDATPPAVLSLGPVSPNPSAGPVDSVIVTFTEPIAPGSLDYRDLILTRSGGVNLIDSSVVVEPVAGSSLSHRISGLARLASAPGDYVFTVVTTGIEDLAGNPGLDESSIAWSLGSIDETPPVSSVSPLPEETLAERFLVEWSGDDEGGSGIDYYEIFVSVDDGPFDLWLRTESTSAEFPGVRGRGYAFYSVAVDRAGNREAPPTTADARTRVPQSEPPRILETLVQGGMTQRSHVNRVAWVFSESVNLQGLIDDGSIVSVISLTNLGVDAPAEVDQPFDLRPGQFRYDPATFTLSWSLDEFGDGSTSLPDGLYLWRIDAAAVLNSVGEALDGDGDGASGGDYVLHIHRLLGDVTGDGRVDGAPGSTDRSTDLGLVNDAFGARPGNLKWNPEADVDGDGYIGGLDRLIVTRNLGRAIIRETSLGDGEKAPAEPQAKTPAPTGEAISVGPSSPEASASASVELYELGGSGGELSTSLVDSGSGTTDRLDGGQAVASLSLFGREVAATRSNVAASVSQSSLPVATFAPTTLVAGRWGLRSSSSPKLAASMNPRPSPRVDFRAGGAIQGRGGPMVPGAASIGFAMAMAGGAPRRFAPIVPLAQGANHDAALESLIGSEGYQTIWKHRRGVAARLNLDRVRVGPPMRPKALRSSHSPL